MGSGVLMAAAARSEVAIVIDHGRNREMARISSRQGRIQMSSHALHACSSSGFADSRTGEWRETGVGNRRVFDLR